MKQNSKDISKSFFQGCDVTTVVKDVTSLPINTTSKLRLLQGHSYSLKHTLSPSDQKIYVLLEQGSTCSLSVTETVLPDSLDQAVEYHIVLEQDATLDMALSFVDALDMQCRINVYLQGDRAQANIKGIYALDNKQKLDIQTYQYHGALDSQSNLVMKGMLKDDAKVSYQGLIKIDEQAKRTDASQENKNIVLSKRAKVISVPSIEVLQYDVQCCHGSAIGKFDEEQLWYLQSKGLSSKVARQLLVRSFFNDVLDGRDKSDELLQVLCKKMV